MCMYLHQELMELRAQMAAHGVPPPGPPQPIPPHMSGMPMDPMQMPGMPLAPPLGADARGMPQQPQGGVNGGGFAAEERFAQPSGAEYR